MAAANGNLSLEERRGLRPGAVVSWQGPRMLAEQVGTVDSVGPGGHVHLCDGPTVGQDDFCRLVSAAPMVLTQPTVRGLDGDGVRPEGPTEGSQGPREGSGDAGAASGPPAGEPDATGQKTSRACQDCGKPLEAAATAGARFCMPCRRRRQGQANGRQRADRGLWLEAVQAVNAGRRNGETTEQAVAETAKDARFDAIKLTVQNYRWWLHEFERAGQVSKPPSPRQPARQAEGAGPAVAAMADLAGQLAEARAEVERLKAALREAAEARPQGLPEALTAGCAERLRLVQRGEALLADLRSEADELSQAVEGVRRYPWALRHLRRAVETMQAVDSETKGGVL